MNLFSHWLLVEQGFTFERRNPCTVLGRQDHPKRIEERTKSMAIDSSHGNDDDDDDVVLTPLFFLCRFVVSSFKSLFLSVVSL